MIGGVSPFAQAQPEPASAPSLSSSPQTQREMFLKLLVAQIRNQNPLDPADGVQFLSQLAQFSELEQIIEVRNELAGIRQALQTEGTK